MFSSKKLIIFKLNLHLNSKKKFINMSKKDKNISRFVFQ